MGIKGRGYRTIITPEDRRFVYDELVKGRGILQIAEELNFSAHMLKRRCNDEIVLAKAKIIESGGYELPSRTTEITPDQRFQIRKLAGYGLNYDQISIIVGMSRSTLVERCKDDLDLGRAEAHHAVAKNLYEMAADPGKRFPAETKFYLKAREGWREATQIEFPDGDGNLQKIGGDLNINLSADKMQNLIAILDQLV